jgi:uncharacterized protein (TIGR03437 family)
MLLLVLVLAAAALWAQPQLLVFSTYLGGRESDVVYAAAVDAAGNVYVAGQTYSRDFPVAGPVRTSCTLSSLGGCADAFVAKLSPDGSRLVYSIYYGTSGPDEATGIAVNPDGTAWVVGTANNAIFLLKLSPEGRQEFARSIPTYPLARAHAVALDRQGNVYITGETLGQLPLMRPLQDRLGAPSCTAAGGSTAVPLDAFVMKFSAAGELLYSTYFGGGGNDSGLAVSVDPAGNIYVAGSTSSRDLTMVNPTQDAYAGGEPTAAGQCEGGDGFVAKISADGSRVLYSTYSGTPAREQIAAIHVSPEGYLTAVRSGSSGLLETFSPEGNLLWERAAPSSQSVMRDRGGTIYLAILGYMLYDSAGLNPRFPLPGSPLQTSVVRPLADGTVLLAGTVASPGGLAVVNAIQPVFGGVLDGGVALFRPLPEGCNTGVLVNGASYRGPYVAPESLATLFGCALDGVTKVQVTDATGASAAARIIAATSTQLNLVLPRSLAPGPAVLTARRGDLVPAQASAHIETAAPAIFTSSATGEGAPAALALRVAPDGSRSTTPVADCGESGCHPLEIDLGGPQDRTYLLLFGTGIRFAGQARLSVRANSVELPILGYAAQSEYAGLDQVNVELPRALAGAGAVELQLAIDGKLANPVVIHIK